LRLRLLQPLVRVCDQTTPDTGWSRPRAGILQSEALLNSNINVTIKRAGTKSPAVLARLFYKMAPETDSTSHNNYLCIYNKGIQ